ncbi:MAG: neutral zinc metallopeptidase, partial [Sutterellaceae bacterium]|nr:neutral zinc metallopeptidase [Sutterellaceae bacterium]
MRWQNRDSSSNVEDHRGESSGGGFRGGIPIRGKGGIALLIIVLVAGYYG